MRTKNSITQAFESFQSVMGAIVVRELNFSGNELDGITTIAPITD